MSAGLFVTDIISLYALCRNKYLTYVELKKLGHFPFSLYKIQQLLLHLEKGQTCDPFTLEEMAVTELLQYSI